MAARPRGSATWSFLLVGQTDADIFEHNLLEVMQFVFNHTTFDPQDEIDQKHAGRLQAAGRCVG